jgi:FMN reductase
MSLVVTVSASPVAASRTQLLTAAVGASIATRGIEVQAVNVRDLPAEDLLWARGDAPGLQRAVDLIARADGVVVATPVYKAAYTGVLKTFLDLLPQFGLQGKAVLPLATGGTLAHVLAIDYGLRPVLMALGAQHVVGGLFILDKLLERQADGGLRIDPEVKPRLDEVVGAFVASVRAGIADRARAAAAAADHAAPVPPS